VELDAPAPPPVELFTPAPASPIELASVIAGARPGDIVQLGEGTYLGPARVPDGVTVRGLGPDRTTIDGMESAAVAVGAGARLEHCSVVGGGERIVWLPKPVVLLAGAGASLLGCRIDGHVEVSAPGARVTSCGGTGLVAKGVDRVHVARSTFTGMQWDCAIDIADGAGHLIESCDVANVLVGIRLTRTVGALVRGNRLRGRWWAVQLVDTDGTIVSGNAIERTMRAVDVDGGTLAEITGNAVLDGDSGCVLQRGAAGVVASGNHWERCRIGLLAWDAGAFRQHDNTMIELGEPGHEVVIGP
jgi:alpha-L-fucosidase